MNKKYPPSAFVGAFLLQWWVWSRNQIVKDARHSDIWYLENIGLIGLALLLLAPVLRHGVIWQRVVAGLLCVFPVVFVAAWFYYSFTELTE
jgi:hypothetical protein